MPGNRTPALSLQILDPSGCDDIKEISEKDAFRHCGSAPRLAMHKGATQPEAWVTFAVQIASLSAPMCDAFHAPGLRRTLHFWRTTPKVDAGIFTLQGENTRPFDEV